METGRIILELLVVLAASRIAAEVSERARQPAVLGEILLGIVIGPSVLGIAGGSGALSLLGEIGVILLLFEVGRQMDLAELLRVGGASLRVAVIGVVVPMFLGYVVMRALGVGSTGALFIAAAITATSVGITARVFGDLRALAMSEARTVLGAAVVDDVIGLLILTVVTRIADGDHLNAASIVGLAVAAIGFVAIATIVGTWIAPKLLEGVSSRARTDGTLMALGLIVALGFARLAEVAQLAPIVGSFVAGLAVGRSNVAEDLHRKLTPLGHFFIPIFFLQIGIDTHVRTFADGDVLTKAGILCVVAIVGKLVSGLGASGDRVLVGAGMIPRGEVGLIFASLGLSRGVLDAQTYAILLLVVLVSSLVTPPWVRRRIEGARKRAFELHADAVAPPNGWLTSDLREVELAADPPPVLAPTIAFDAAIACATRRPGSRLVEWCSNVPLGDLEWTAALRGRFLTLLREGNDRSWRFLDTTGMLSRTLPVLDAAVRARPRDPFDLEPTGTLRWTVLEDLKRVVDGEPAAYQIWAKTARQDLVLMGALARSVIVMSPRAVDTAHALAASVGFADREAQQIAFLVDARGLLQAAAARHDMGTEEQILDLASYIEDRETADALYVLAVAENAMEVWERERLDELFRLIGDALSHPDLTGRSARELVEQRQAAVAARLPNLSNQDLRSLVWSAPRRYLLTSDTDRIVRHVSMLETPLGENEVRLHADLASDPDGWIVHCAVRDRLGVLATIANTFASVDISVESAQISTWRSGVAVDVFEVRAKGVQWDAVRAEIAKRLAEGTPSEPVVVDGFVSFDNLASPWHTIIEVQARDRSGLLAKVASALSGAGVDIHQATVATRDGVAVDTFWVSGPNGGKLDEPGEKAVRAAFAGKGVSRKMRRAAKQKVRAGASADAGSPATGV